MGKLQKEMLTDMIATATGVNPSDTIENKTFDEIQIGDKASICRVLSEDDVQLFGILSGDVNPTHFDEDFAKQVGLDGIAGHSMWAGLLISGILGTELPGPGTIYRSQNIEFCTKLRVGDSITVTVTATSKDEETKNITFDCVAINQDGITMLKGVALVGAPTEKIISEKTHLREIHLTNAHGYDALIEKAKGLEPICVAVVHPTDRDSLMGPVEAGKIGLINPILVGPEAKIRSLAQEENIDLTGIEIINTAHSHESAEKGVELVRIGRAEAVMKGNLHTDELMREVVNKTTGLRTARRISHVFVMQVPTYSKLLLVTDAAINIYPDLMTKVDIVQNAIELAIVLGVDVPKVAILSAVETVTPGIQSTIEAAALCKMADRKQITGAVLDGPLAFDNAISERAAKIKGIKSPVAGKADILLVPDLEAGNILAKQLEYLADAHGAGIVLGAKVPIILTSRADTVASRMASCAVALLLAHARRKAIIK